MKWYEQSLFSLKAISENPSWKLENISFYKTIFLVTLIACNIQICNFFFTLDGVLVVKKISEQIPLTFVQDKYYQP